jgi:hypothetical protein
MPYLPFGTDGYTLGFVSYHISELSFRHRTDRHTDNCLLVPYSCDDTGMNSD